MDAVLRPKPASRGGGAQEVLERALVILCIHPNVELYGSDRSFIQVISALKQAWPKARLNVLLSGEGPLNPAVAEIADQVLVRSQCVLRRANPLATLTKATVAFPFYFIRALRNLARADFIYINTVVDPAHLLAARLASSKVAVHVHEIPARKVLPLFRALCRIAGTNLIFNSHATAEAFAIPASQRQIVVHNGVAPVPGAAPPAVPAAFTRERPLRIAMLGRINDWKGQDLLIDAISRLDAGERELIDVRIVGGTYLDVQEPIGMLEAQLASAKLQGIVSIEPFRDEPASVYQWCDLSIVPSKKPEPFGMVAIESMAHARPVIAAAHGGLPEIIEDGESGTLFPPNNAEALADCIRESLRDPEEIERRGAAALARFEAKFDTNTMWHRIQEAMCKWSPALAMSAVAPSSTAHLPR